MCNVHACMCGCVWNDKQMNRKKREKKKVNNQRQNKKGIVDCLRSVARCLSSLRCCWGLYYITFCFAFMLCSRNQKEEVLASPYVLIEYGLSRIWIGKQSETENGNDSVWKIFRHWLCYAVLCTLYAEWMAICMLDIDLWPMGELWTYTYIVHL